MGSGERLIGKSVIAAPLMDMDIDFNCTGCGNCCKESRLPLSAAEAVRWLQDGHPVQVLCEAIPWPGEPPAADLLGAFKRERSFSAVSGALPIRVLVTLAAPLGQSCPNLLADNRCGIYERRPDVCRIYPAETNPFRALVTAGKRCPPEAWQAGGRPLMRNALPTDRELRRHIESRLLRMVADVPLQEELCATLGVRTAALANEGYAVHSPDSGNLLQVLLAAGKRPPPARQGWDFITDCAKTVEAIRSCDARCFLASDHSPGGVEYLSLGCNQAACVTAR